MFYVIMCIFYFFLSHFVLFYVIYALLPEINVMDGWMDGWTMDASSVPSEAGIVLVCPCLSDRAKQTQKLLNRH